MMLLADNRAYLLKLILKAMTKFHEIGSEEFQKLIRQTLQ